MSLEQSWLRRYGASRASLRKQLLTGILVPLALIGLVGAWSLYDQAFDAANRAYDRTLLASAKTISEQIDVQGYDAAARIRALVPFSALEAFQNDNQSRIFYRVSGPDGSTVSGYADLPVWQGSVPDRPNYDSLVDFYDDRYQGVAVRVAALLQPVVGPDGRGMALIQVAETLELRKAMARQLLTDSLWRHAVLALVVGAVVVLVVQRVTRPVRQLSADLDARPEGDLSPLSAEDAPREMLPLIDATNTVMARLRHLLEHQKRFVRDASHQLRTPLAVLKVQVQSARRGDLPSELALAEIAATVERATELANRMLSLARIEQLRHQGDSEVTEASDEVRAVALDLAPLIADRRIDFDIHTESAPVRAHAWMLQELTRNLLHNAVRHTPPHGRLTVRLVREGNTMVLTIDDDGPGISAELAARLFQPFSAGDERRGSGLGLTICREITNALGGSVSVNNRVEGDRVSGLTATVRLPMPSRLRNGAP